MRRLRKNNQTPEALKLLGFSVVLAFSACDLSADAKLLYCLFLDRMGVSARNGWKDERGEFISITRLSKFRKI